jgi:uncharacterized repeat protein (TIGR01451 family)
MTKKLLFVSLSLFFGSLFSGFSQTFNCGDTFFDPGGISANYIDNTDNTVTITPPTGQVVTVTFTQFATEGNFDGLYVFNGNSIAAPQIASTNPAGGVPGGLAGSFWGTTIPGPFTSSSPDGSLTFRFRTDGSVTAAGWIATISCSLPITCLKPTALTVSSITSTSASLSWTNNSTATQWEVITLPCGSPLPTATSVGTSSTTIPHIITGLSPFTCYTVYVRNVCSTSDVSLWSVGANFTALNGPPICGGLFLDPGEGANYNNSLDSTTTICPTIPGDVVTVTFTQFATEISFDGLYVYDGNSISAPQISSTNPAGNVPGGLPGSFWGTTIPGPFESTPGGCLTFRFRSDGSVTGAGWVANITCAPPPTCPKPNALASTTTTINQTTLSWNNNSSATTWHVLALPCGSPLPTATSTGWQTTTTNPFVYTGLNPDTCYTFYVRGVCSVSDTSNWSTGLNVITLQIPPACGGIFTDNGGINGNYTDNADSTVVICPINVGDLVTVTFTQFNTSTNADGLYVFDGNSINAPQITSANGAGIVPGGLPGSFWGTTIPGPFTSSSADGCLTFRFRSTAVTNLSGWVANVTCAPAPTCPKPNGLVASSTTINQTTLTWNGNSSATTWQVLALACGSPAPTPTSTGWVTATTNPYVYTGLSPDTCYTFYVRGVCSPTDISDWSQGASTTTQLIPPACGGTYTDAGGSNGNYLNNADNIVTICPTNPNELVTVTFTQFDTQVSSDGLYVFDGNSISAPQIPSGNGAGTVPGGLTGSFWGTTIPGPFTSTSPDGCLTFRFRSNGATTATGWIANVTCSLAPDRILLIAFVDSNSNGIKEGNENYFNYGSYITQLNNSGINNFVNASTGFHTILDSNSSNSYDLSFQINPEYLPYFSTASLINQDISIAFGSGTQVFYYPVTSLQLYNDVAVSIVSINPPRPNQTYQNNIVYTNNGTASASGTLSFTKDPNATLTYISQPGVTNTADGFTFNYTNLLPFETRTIFVTMSLPNSPTINIGDIVTTSASITAATDVNMNNNSFVNNQIVVASHDPNDKIESHGGRILHSAFTTGDYLYYTIHFENTGTDDARSIIVSDVLDSQLNESSIRMVEASHSYVMTRTGNSVLWNFENINLPPSVPNLNVGKGYVIFKIKPLPGYQVGDIIPNMATIYFESNPGINTNTFNTEFVSSLANAQFNSEFIYKRI